MENNTDKKPTQTAAFAIALEAAKIMFHGTNNGLTAAEVAIKLDEHCRTAWMALPKKDESADQQ